MQLQSFILAASNATMMSSLMRAATVQISNTSVMPAVNARAVSAILRLSVQE